MTLNHDELRWLSEATSPVAVLRDSIKTLEDRLQMFARDKNDHIEYLNLIEAAEEKVAAALLERRAALVLLEPPDEA